MTKIGDSNPAKLDPLEEEAFHPKYAEYFLSKKRNCFSSLITFRDLWECLQVLNDIWMQGLSDLDTLTDEAQVLPKILFAAAHARFLTAIELGFSCCIGDAYSILRDGIESVSHAHKLSEDPTLIPVWSNKNNGKAEMEAHDAVFKYNKVKNLFPDKHGLKELHRFYGDFCEMATHSSVTSVGKSFEYSKTDTHHNIRFHYFETDRRKLAVFLSALLEVSSRMEGVFFACFETRLNLDIALVPMREKFRTMKQKELDSLRTTYKLDSI
jgi:hypothetical protein